MVCKLEVKYEIGMQFMSSRKALEDSLIRQCFPNKKSPCTVDNASSHLKNFDYLKNLDRGHFSALAL